MAALIENIAPRRRQAQGGIASFDDWVGLWGLSDIGHLLQTTMPKSQELPDYSFAGMVASTYLRNSVVFACLAIRARLFSEARFQFQQMRGGRPGNLFGTPALTLLERPEPGKTTRDLLQMAILHADLGGNGFLLGRQDAIRRMRPDWVTIAYASKKRDSELGSWDPDAEVIGYGYYPGGYGSGEKVIAFGPDEIAHFAPTKDPLARNRGISLLWAGTREIMADNAATTSKLAFFNNAATPNLALKFPLGMNKEKAQEWIDLFEQERHGATNAARTIYLGSGVEPVPVGLSFRQQEFTEIAAKAETRIAALTGMHPVVVALSEGLAGSSLNAGNFGSAARLVGDATLRPLWGDMAGSLETIVPPLPGTRLWFDDRDIAFLREDVKDQAEITKNNAATIGQLVKDGFTADSSIDATVTGDMSRLVHSGLVSVQLQPPGTSLSGPAAPPAAYRVRGDFWAIDEPLAALGPLTKGQSVAADHPVVRAFPSLFEAQAMPADLAGRALALLSQGKTVPQIAASIERTERHVRRLLAASA